MQEKKSWRTYSALFFHQKLKVQKVPFSLQGLSLYRAPNEVKYQHTLKKSLYKEGKSGKKRKQYQKVKIWAPNEVKYQRTLKKALYKSQNMGGRKFRTGENFARGCEIFAQGCEKIRSAYLLFSSCSSSAFDFKSVKLVLSRIGRAWIDSTNLALIACKNYKISHKLRSVE